jgi:hypothetical protein
MTIKKLLAKYTRIVKAGHESILLSEVIGDLWQIIRAKRLRKAGIKD